MKAMLLISSLIGLLEAGPVPFYFKTKLDHYTAGGEETPTFNMKYLVDTQYF
jgi:pimeloyl-ACP methyl ester carboxylesterase